MNSDFHITVGAGLVAGAQKQPQVEYEMRMLKSALLYADRITLVSFTSACLAPVIGLTSFSHRDRVEIIEKCLSVMCSQMEEPDLFRFTVKMHRELLSKTERLSKQDEAKLAELEHLSQYMIEGAQEDLKFRLAAYDVDSYQAAVGTGAVQLATSGVDTTTRAATLLKHMLKKPGATITEDLDLTTEIATEFLCSLSLATMNGSYLLLDQYIGEGLGSLVLGAEKLASEVQLKRAKHISLAADILGRLPNLEIATFDEITDIRKEYQLPLQRFRVALMRFSEEIQSAPWTSEFTLEAEDLFRAYVEPEIANIEEQMKSNKFISKLIQRLGGSDINVPTGSALGICLSSMYFLPDVASKILGVGVGGALLASNAYKEWRDKQSEVEKNQMYFYYEAKRKVGI